MFEFEVPATIAVVGSLRLTPSRHARSVRLLLVALTAAVLSGVHTGNAHAGYPVQPYDGAVVSTLTPTFLIYKDNDESSARVDISTSPQTSSSGSLILGSGYIGSCTPSTPYGEPGKFSCSPKFSSEGVYYWQFVYDKYVCEALFGSQFCSHRRQYGPVWRLEVKLPEPPAVAALPILRGPSPLSRRDPLYSSIASQIARKPARVYCWSAADWNMLHVRRREQRGEGLTWILGYVPRGTTEINLAPEVCKRLDAIAYRKLRPRGKARIDFAEAVDTLAHEAVHALGVTDEARTECYSLQLMDYTGLKLGTSHAYARDMSRQAWNVLYPQIPAEYQTSDCYNGGPLDLYPNSDVWP